MISEPSNLNTNILHKGFRIIIKKHVTEINAVCGLFEHIKSGARVLKIFADDPNKTFSIAFKTIPESDAGTPHILEHSVLNGSRNFPVKSPFDLLSKGSLNTFLNAMTYPDFTIYPVASLNEKDYFNLMHVYLDAVFYPILYSEPRIFMQEGWHYELKDIDAPLLYKGVVYNEMKGVFSNPERELWYQVQKNLFPQNGYRYSSGGYPDAITKLTYNDFVNFHKKNYHPSNSYIFLYGNGNFEEELKLLDSEYLSKFEPEKDHFETPVQAPFLGMKEINSFYPVIESTSTDHQTYLAMNWVTGKGYDPVHVMALEILAEVLVNQESSPVRKALHEAGIGKDSFAHTQNNQQNIFSIVVPNANASEKDTFRSILFETLVNVVSDKINKESVLGSLNRIEFRLREGDDAQKGLAYNIRCITGWLFMRDPFPFLEYEAILAKIKALLKGGYLEDLIQKEFLENNHALLITLEPKKGLEMEIAGKISSQLAEFKNGLTPEELEAMVNNTQDLIDYQKKTDSPEAIATIPILKLTDINPEQAWYEVTPQNIDGTNLLYHSEFTHNIVYQNYWFDLRSVPQDLIPYANLLSELLGKMDTENYSYDLLDKALNINTGGFHAFLNVFLPDHNDANMLPLFRIVMKATSEKLDSAMPLLTEILSRTRLDNRDRLGELIKRHQSQLESAVIQNGLGVALTRLESYYSRRGAFNDLTRGIEYFWFVNDLVKNFNADPAKVTAQIEKVRDLLFTRANLTVGITCSEDDLKSYTHYLPTLLSSLNTIQPPSVINWSILPVIKNEGIETASKVQYVLQGYDFRKLGLTWDSKWYVLSHILTTDWLHNRIRVLGGAYGGYSAINRNGTIYLASYRDPNLKETLDNFKETVDYLAGFHADYDTMSRYIIGTIANIDSLLTPSEKGDVAFRRYFENVTREELRNDRHSILETTGEDIRKMSGLIASVLDQQVLCVYGNDGVLKANRNLFQGLVLLQR